MEIRKVQAGGTLTLFLEGSLNTLSAPALENEINAVPQDTEELILDMEKLEYISSAGLRVLITAHKHMGLRGRMMLAHVCPGVMEILTVTGLTKVFAIE